MSVVSSRARYPELCVADKEGRIYNVPFLASAGMRGGHYSRLRLSRMTKLPYGSQLFMLPDRFPVGFDPESREFVSLEQNPFNTKGPEPCYAVAAFMAPGYTVTENAAYLEIPHTGLLPLFAYAAVAFYEGDFYVSGIRVDRELRQDVRFMDMKRVRRNVKIFEKMFPKNRLVRHLENCALVNQCPAAKNFFLKRYEGPLPTSPSCNAQCAGCLSLQPGGTCPVTQPRIRFVPSPEEIAEVALFHILHVKDPVVSFGQGCEGEPLLAGPVIEKAVKLIRSKTRKGIINLNTNASRPRMIAKLLDAGLDSIRVSLNSVQTKYYERYYQPKDYSFKDVKKSVRVARKRGAFISLNYLIIPGFTDSRQEVAALQKFLAAYPVDMIQWRNLNYDPRAYFRLLRFHPAPEALWDIPKLIRFVKKTYPRIMTGYFNPSKKRIKRRVSL